MRVVMTLCVKNEQDVLDAHLSFHLNAGVDFVIVTDTGSTDASLEILDRYRRAGLVDVRHDHTRPFDQGDLQTAMARSAAVDHGADWVIGADADEFWWPRGRGLKDVLELVPSRYGIVYGIWRPYVARPDDGEPFWERMTVRLSPANAINDPTSKFRPNVNVAHRGHPQVRVGGGNHDLIDPPFPPLRGWCPFEVLHFPIRDPAQMVRKFERVRDNVSVELIAYLERAALAERAGDSGAFLELVVDQEDLEQGLDAGVLFWDYRLRDTLRALFDERSRSFALPSERSGPIEFEPPSLVDDARFAADVAVAGEADVIRAQRRLDNLEQRLRVVEKLPSARLTRNARSLARRVRARTRRLP
jgi:Glycosyl transferase family 2